MMKLQIGPSEGERPNFVQNPENYDFIALEFSLYSGAPIEIKPWVEPCVGSKPSSFNFVTTEINDDSAAVVQRLQLKTKQFLEKINKALAYVRKDLVSDADLIRLLNGQPKTPDFPSDLLTPQKQNAETVNKENYLKITQLYILIESYILMESKIDNKLHAMCDEILVSLRMIMCELSFVVNISGYKQLTSLSKDTIQKQHIGRSASAFYRWEYILLRDISSFGPSLRQSVEVGLFNSN